MCAFPFQMMLCLTVCPTSSATVLILPPYSGVVGGVVGGVAGCFGPAAFLSSVFVLTGCWAGETGHLHQVGGQRRSCGRGGFPARTLPFSRNWGRA